MIAVNATFLVYALVYETIYDDVTIVKLQTQDIIFIPHFGGLCFCLLPASLI